MRRTIQFYAGLAKLAPRAWANRQNYAVRSLITMPAGYSGLYPDMLENNMEGFRQMLLDLEAGKELAESPGFYASFDDPEFGLNWKACSVEK